MKSTKRQLEAELKIRKPKDAIDTVFESRGGLVGAHSEGECPEVILKHITWSEHCSRKSLKQAWVHECLSVHHQLLETCCLLSWSNASMQRRSIDLFKMLHVLQSPWPFFVLTNNSWISTDSAVTLFRFCIFGVDPTFNLSNFSVTPTVYRHLLLEDPKLHSHLCFNLGPMRVHYHKQLSLLLFNASWLESNSFCYPGYWNRWWKVLSGCTSSQFPTCLSIAVLLLPSTKCRIPPSWLAVSPMFCEEICARHFRVYRPGRYLPWRAVMTRPMMSS